MFRAILLDSSFSYVCQCSDIVVKPPGFDTGILTIPQLLSYFYTQWLVDQQLVG